MQTAYVFFAKEEQSKMSDLDLSVKEKTLIISNKWIENKNSPEFKKYHDLAEQDKQRFFQELSKIAEAESWSADDQVVDDEVDTD